VEIENSNPGKDISTEDIKTKFPLAAKKSPNHKTSVKVGNIEIGGRDIVTMMGPNLVENRKMIFLIAQWAKENGVSILRGGCFKPLTFPYRGDKYFETGIQGLKWLAEAGKSFDIPVITEAVSESQVALVAEYSDIIQIGTRNMQNFPLLTTAAKTQKPILLKRGFGSSLRDFMGAAEYILLEGNSSLILCERGIVVPHTHRSTSRFLLDLQIIPAVKEISHLPIITDPSHATFWAPWVKPLALASVAAGADGVMIETHMDPRNAAIDPLQPLDLIQSSELVQSLNLIAKIVRK
jgi:3-deoxy-7-phosphoheptulonate synthase